MKSKIKMLSFVLLATIVLTTPQTVSASTEDTQSVAFACLAAGKSVVIWNALELETPVVPGIEWYAENSTGFTAFGGSAQVEEGEWPYLAWEWPYMADSGAVCCVGFLAAKWTHDDKSYRLRIVFHSTEETMGVFDPENDSFGIGNLIPNEPPTMMMMEFDGILVENGDSQQISGVAMAWVLVWDPPAKTIHLFLGIDLGGGVWLPVGVVWANIDGLHEESGIYFQKAQIFLHGVKLLDS